LWSAEEEEGPPAASQPGGNSNGRAPQSAEDRRIRLVGLLGPAPVNVDDLVRAMGCPASEVRALLFELEVAGRLARYGGDLVALVPD
jgi:DNA processing protein